MRLLPLLLALPLFALQAHAQTAPPQPSGAAPTAPTAAASQHHRTSWQQHFAQANLAHDGHLTLEEASGGYVTVARHFKEIDVGKKGYVTEEDIDTWHKLQRAMRHRNQGHADDGLRPRPAFQRSGVEPRQFNTSTDGKMVPPPQPDPSPAGQSESEPTSARSNPGT
jgi:hypothetical protein